jgi:sigma-B regulation protein RsbU (phosphoserine phosphatase)
LLLHGSAYLIIKHVNLKSINAGHNPIYVHLSDSGQIKELNDGGLFLGSLEMPYISEIIKPSRNDCIVFYTDGITEALNLKEEEYGEQNLWKLLNQMLEKRRRRFYKK